MVPLRLPHHRHGRSPFVLLRVPLKRASSTSSSSSSSSASGARTNIVGIQMLSQRLHRQVFGGYGATASPSAQQRAAAEGHLKQHGLWGRPTESRPVVDLRLPKLQGATAGGDLKGHMTEIGRRYSEPYWSYAKTFASLTKLPERPEKWIPAAGWTQYTPGQPPRHVEFPSTEETTVVFDVEVLKRTGTFPTLAVAVSEGSWYVWVCEGLAELLQNPALSPQEVSPSKFQQLVPFGRDSSSHRLIIGHNVGYDRARILEEYHFCGTNNRFLDTMSLHIITAGLSTQQRISWMKHQAQKEDPDGEEEDDDDGSRWFEHGSTNSLAAVYQHHCSGQLDKTARSHFMDGTIEDIVSNFDMLVSYSANDVSATFEVFVKLLPSFEHKCRHPVTFAGMLEMGTCFLPTSSEFNRFIERCDGLVKEKTDNISAQMAELAIEAAKAGVEKADAWTKNFDWTVKEAKMTKPKFKKDGSYAKNGEPRPVKRSKLPGYPKWFIDLCPTGSSVPHITSRSRIAPYLLRLEWSGYPLRYMPKLGWGYVVPAKTPLPNVKHDAFLMDEDLLFYKIPHKSGPKYPCGNPLAKTYQQYVDTGVLSSKFSTAQEALTLNTTCSYWISSANRVKSQYLKKLDRTELPPALANETDVSIILPQVVVAGTVTRRAVEPTWMTASNPKPNVVGSELKTTIRAPRGYNFVGADVDSQELWIAALMGDSVLGMHGGTALGWMTLQGKKSDGTDLHSRTASIMGISRDEAKIFNYSRLYGAGKQHAIQLLLNFNKDITKEEAEKKAAELYKQTKGVRGRRPSGDVEYVGGSESYSFNSMERIARSKDPRTPVLECQISDALLPHNLQRADGDSTPYMTSRVNWVVQSSGVDYLHLLLVNMRWMKDTLGLGPDTRFVISIHDEVRYVTDSDSALKVAYALQVSNLLTRAYFAEKLHLRDLPQSVAFFSAIDIDTVLRKEVNQDCTTPSQVTPIPHGKQLDIYGLLREFPQADSKAAEAAEQPPSQASN